MPDVLPAFAADQPGPMPALPLRNDTMLGVCEGLGEEFGFNPTYLRLAFAGLFYWSPVAVVGTYLALGLGLALARWLYPAAPAATGSPALLAAPAPANEADPVSLAA